MNLKRSILLMIMIPFMGIVVFSQGFEDTYRRVNTDSPVQDKLFYFLSILETNEEAKNVLMQNAELKKIYETQRNWLETTYKENRFAKPHTAVEKLIYQDKQIDQVGKILQNLVVTNKEIEKMVNMQLRPSGCYQLYATQDNKEYIYSVWKQVAEGLNIVLERYALGKDGLYPEIDSASYPIYSSYYTELLTIALSEITVNEDKNTLFFQNSLSLSLWLLDVNARNDAGYYEPMMFGENQKTFLNINSIAWDKYEYSFMLLPGYGPKMYGIPLSGQAKLRLAYVAENYHKGLVPIIVVSGGTVHPYHTTYCEAVEMKRGLMEIYNVPEEAILIEPHARHTTTNFRNANRLAYRYGIPTDKKALVTTDQFQSHYITDPEFKFDERNMNELGYLPYKMGKRIDHQNVEFYPVIESMQVNNEDPLDP